MASKGATSKSSKGDALPKCNYVGQDQIWKDHVEQEVVAAKRWPDTWTFLTQKYEDVVKDDFPKTERERLLPPTPLRPPEVTPLHELVDVYPSPKPVPNTTSGMIGWRSSERKLRLEKYGRYAKPKGALIGQLNWPTEAIS